MPVKTQWDNEEKTIIRNDFEGAWTWKEFIDTMDMCVKWIREVDYEVSIINNLKNGVIPRGNALSIGQSVLKKLPENCGALVVVTNPLAALFAKVLTKIAPTLAQKVIPVADIEKAYEALEKLHESE